MGKQNENLPMKKGKTVGLSRRDFFKIGAASAAVGAAGAREEIADYLHKHEKSPGGDYLFVA